MTDYGKLLYHEIVGSFEGYVRIITETSDGQNFEFHVPYEVTGDSDGLRVQFEFGSVNQTLPSETANSETSCPETLRQTVNDLRGLILSKVSTPYQPS